MKEGHPPARSYVKFILLAHPRSGSTMLLSALEQHPYLRMYGELFNDDPLVRKRFFRADRLDQKRGSRIVQVMEDRRSYQEGESGTNFLSEVVFYPRTRNNVLAVGFKIFYCHARKGLQARSVWKYLVDLPDLRIIHLVRKDLFASWVSLRVALASGEWAIANARHVDKIDAFEGSFEEINSYMRRITRFRQAAENQFAQHPILRITYEDDLCRAWPSTLKKIQDFLNVPFWPLIPTTAKQAQVPARHRLTNYRVLARRFRGTAFADQFSADYAGRFRQ